MSRRRGFLAAPLALLLLAGCVGPSRTDGDYALKAANTAEAVRSAVQTARLGVAAAGRGNAPQAYLSILLGRAEEDAAAAQQSFDAVQPPSERADGLRDQLGELVADAVGVLADLRVLARRGQVHRLAAVAAPLEELAARLGAFEEAHS